jgi:sugar/nucleoside kinase (ribokinase family)
MAPPPSLVCVGSALWDVIGRAPVPLRLGDDVPGRILRHPGGVAMNIALALRRFGLAPALVTLLGGDAAGDELLAQATALGLDCRFVQRAPGLPTDTYLAIEGANGLIAAIADARSLETQGAQILAPLRNGRLGSVARPFAGTLVMDGNLSVGLLAGIATDAALARADLRLAAASPAKAGRLLPLTLHPRATLYLNLAEARVLGQRCFADAAEAAAGLVRLGARRVLVTDGARPAAEATTAGCHVACPPAVTVARVTGAGDTFMAAHIHADLSGAPPPAAFAAALTATAEFISGDR